MIEPQTTRDRDADPGPLDDKALRALLRDPSYVRASKTHDRVQDAFDRLLREKRIAEDTRDVALSELLADEGLATDLLDSLAETRKERAYALVGGFMFGVLATLAVHALGWF